MLANVARDVLPSRLIAFWLAWNYRRGALQVPKFAIAIRSSPAAVHNWISGERGNRRGIHEKFWGPMARFFGFRVPEELIAAARALYVSTKGALSSDVPLEHPEMPVLLREFLRGAAPPTTAPRQPSPPVPRAAVRKSHGTS